MPTKMAGWWREISCLLYNHIECENGDRGSDDSLYLTRVSSGLSEDAAQDIAAWLERPKEHAINI